MAPKAVPINSVAEFDLGDFIAIIATTVAIWFYFTFEIGQLSKDETFKGNIASPDPNDLQEFLEENNDYQNKYNNYRNSFIRGVQMKNDHQFNVANKNLN